MIVKTSFSGHHSHNDGSYLLGHHETQFLIIQLNMVDTFLDVVDIFIVCVHLYFSVLRSLYLLSISDLVTLVQFNVMDLHPALLVLSTKRSLVFGLVLGDYSPYSPTLFLHIANFRGWGLFIFAETQWCMLSSFSCWICAMCVLVNLLIRY